jgi:hypothetical protein
MNPKPQPNRRRYLDVLRRTSPEARLLKAFELSDFAKMLFLTGLRRRFPNANEEELRQIMRERLARCHNWNY